MTPVYLLSVVHPVPQEADKEGEAFGSGIGSLNLGPYGWNLLIGWYAEYVVEVHSHGG